MDKKKETKCFPLIAHGGVRMDNVESTSQEKVRVARERDKDVKLLMDTLEAVKEYLMGGTWIYDKSPDEFIKTAIAAVEKK